MPKGIYDRSKIKVSRKNKTAARKYVKRAATKSNIRQSDPEIVSFECEMCAHRESIQQQQAEALRLAYDKIARYENQEAAVKEWNKEREEEIIVLETENRLFQRFMFILENLNKR